jgi:hypothetical protein
MHYKIRMYDVRTWTLQMTDYCTSIQHYENVYLVGLCSTPLTHTQLYFYPPQHSYTITSHALRHMLII